MELGASDLRPIFGDLDTFEVNNVCCRGIVRHCSVGASAQPQLSFLEFPAVLSPDGAIADNNQGYRSIRTNNVEMKV